MSFRQSRSAQYTPKKALSYKDLRDKISGKVGKRKGVPFELEMLYSVTYRGPGLRMISRIREVYEPITEPTKGGS